MKIGMKKENKREGEMYQNVSKCKNGSEWYLEEIERGSQVMTFLVNIISWESHILL